MKKPPNGCGIQETTPAQRIFSDEERDSVAYFYLRLGNIYGREYRSQLPDKEDENNSKREHGKFICDYSREQIDKGCSWIHTQKQNSEDGWNFMDIDRCIGAIKQANTVKALHRPFKRDTALEDKGAQERAQSAGERELGNMKAMFDTTSTRDTSIEQDLTDKSWANDIIPSDQGGYEKVVVELGGDK